MKTAFSGKPQVKHEKLTKRSDLAESVFAFPKKSNEALTDARPCPQRPGSVWLLVKP